MDTSENTDRMQVTIKLTPLGLEEKHDNHRVINLNNEKREACIGRASKNAHKGLIAGLDNAWFDYPILSRTHAKFTASPAQREVYVEDCGSTHGTYLDKQRLETGVPYTVADGEVITFGQRVTSGAVTYPAKDFRVHTKWETCSPAAPAPISHLVPRQSGFRVPEDYHDSSPEQSREASLEVIESRPRTYSIPSSDGGSDSDSDEEEDDDNIEIVSSVDGECNEHSAATTPDHGAGNKKHELPETKTVESRNDTVQGETRGLNLRGPRLQDLLSKPTTLGTSNQNPIDLEGASAHKHDIADTEGENMEQSDDEGPEILPSRQPLPKLGEVNLSTTWTEAPLTPPQYHRPSVSEVKAQMDTGDQMKRKVLGTQAREYKEVDAGRRQCPEFQVTSIAGDTDGFNSEDDDGFDRDDEFSDLEFAPPLSTYPRAYPQSFVEPRVVKLACTGPANYVKGPESRTQLPRQNFPHNISVSEAIAPVDVSQPSHSDPPAPAPRPPSPSDAALARKAIDPKSAIDRSLNYGSRSSKCADLETFEHQPNPYGILYDEDWTYNWPDLKSPEPPARPYDQGPFSTQYEDGVSQQRPFWAVGRSGNQPAESVKATGGPYSNTGVNSPERCNASSRHSSKLTISSIVNDHYEKTTQSLKRKAEDMSSSNENERSSRPMPGLVPTNAGYQLPRQPPPPSPYSGDVEDRDSCLPDAQPRDSISALLPRSAVQDSFPDSIAELTPTKITTKAPNIEGSACKKARTSSSTSGGIGKFVSGICVGLVGAVAAFIATIPASVTEEALRELANGV